MSRQVTNKARYLRGREFVNKIKLERGCIDCGYKAFASALHFDHVDPATKKFAISKLLCGSIQGLMDEMDKCVVRCANCHAVRTWGNDQGGGE